MGPPPPRWHGLACFAAATWQVFPGVLMCSYGYWLGLLPLAAAVVNFSASLYLAKLVPSQSVPSPVQSTPSQPAVLASVR